MNAHGENAEQARGADLARGEASSSEAGDVLEIISRFEAQLEELKRAQAERRKSEHEFQQRLSALAERERAYEQQVEQLKRDLDVVQQERERVREEQEQLGARADELAQRKAALEAAEADLARRDSELAEAAQAIEQSRHALEARSSQLDARAEAIERAEAEHARRQSEIAEAMRVLEQSRAETSERSNKLEARAHQLEQAEARLTAQAEKLTNRIQALEKQAAEAQAEAGAAAERVAEAERAREQAEAAVRELGAELERVQAEAGALAERMQGRDAEVEALHEKAASLSGQVETLQAELSKRERELEEACRLRAEIERRAGEQLEALAGKLESIERESGRVEHDAESARAQAQELERELTGLRVQLEQAEQKRAEELGRLTEKIESLCAEIEQRDGQIRERDAEIADLKSKLNMAAEKLAQFGEIVKQRGEDSATTEALEKALAVNEKLQERVRELQERATRLEEENAALARRASLACEGARVVHSDEVARIRRARLARVRELLRDQSYKIRRANALLQERFDACEQLLARRAELAAAYQAIQLQQQRIGTSKARSTAAGMVLALVLTVAVLVGLSWVLAGHVHPGLYAATAAIEADAGERTLNEQELAEWQTYHENLLDDPRFIEAVCDALKRRGMATLATPGALSAYLDESMTIQSPGDGRIELELRGQGAARTQRVLDTLVVAMARTGNRTRARRLDGASSVIVQPATALKDPLDHSRLTYAGVIFGGGFVLTSFFGVFAWKKMAHAKTRFEHDQQLQALLSEARWTDPRIDIDAPASDDEDDG